MVITNVAFLFYVDLHQMLGIFTWKYVICVEYVYIVPVYLIEFDVKRLQNFFLVLYIYKLKKICQIFIFIIIDLQDVAKKCTGKSYTPSPRSLSSTVSTSHTSPYYTKTKKLA